MKKRILMAVLAFIIACSAFGCAKNDTTESQSAGATPEVILAEGQDATAAPLPQVADNGLGIKILLEQDDDMKNNYSVIAVNEAAPFHVETVVLMSRKDK